MTSVDRHPWRDLRRVVRNAVRADVGAVVLAVRWRWLLYVTTRLCDLGIRDCPTCRYDEWPRFRLFLPIRRPR